MSDRETIGEINVAIGADGSDMEAEFLALQRRVAASMERIEQSLKSFTTQVQRTSSQAKAPIKDIENGFTQFGTTTDRIFTGVGNRMRLFARDMRSFSGAFSLVSGLSAFGVGRQFVETAGGLEQTLEIIKTLSGGASDEMERLKQQTLELGSNTARTAGQVAQGELELQKMGRSLADITKILPSVTNFSVAADMPMDRAANLAQSTLTQFRLQADSTGEVMDKLMRGANQSAADVGDFAVALSYAGQQAKNANVSLDRTLALMEAASQGGIPGSRLGTGLQSVINDIYMPNIRQQSIFRKAGIDIKDAEGHARDLYLVLQDIFDKLPRSKWNMFEVDTQNYLMTLQSQGLDSVKAREADVALNSAGEAAKTADARMKGLKGTLDQLGGAFDTFLVKVGDSGALDAFTRLVKSASDWLNTMSDADKATLQTAAAIGAITLAATPLMFVLSSVIALLTSPEGLIAAAVVAGVAASAYMDLAAKIKGVQSAMKENQPFEQKMAELRAKLAKDTGEAANETRKLMQAEQDRHAELTKRAQDAANKPLGLAGKSRDLTADNRKRLEAKAKADELAKVDYEQGILAAQATGTKRYRPTLKVNPDAPPAAPADDQALLGNGFNGYGLAPSEERAKQITQLRAQIAIAGEGAVALQKLQMAQQTYDTAQQAGQPISMAAAKAHANKVVALQNELGAIQRGIQAEADYQKAQDDAAIARREREAGLAQEYNDMGRLAAAAREGARAYRILQEEMRIGSSMTPMERVEGAKDIRKQAEAFVDQQDTLDRAEAQMQRMKDLTKGVGDAFGSMFENAILEGKKLSEVLQGLAQDLAALIIRKSITEPMANMITSGLNSGGAGILGAIGSFFGGFFAEGGDPPLGKASIVGEKGPEIFVPKVPGTIIPNHAIGGARGGGGGSTVIHLRQEFNLQGATTSDQLRREMAAVGQLAVAEARGAARYDSGRAAFKKVG